MPQPHMKLNLQTDFLRYGNSEFLIFTLFNGLGLPFI
jgi:hypothetical protein